jgi:hypothetical protein
VEGGVREERSIGGGNGGGIEGSDGDGGETIEEGGRRNKTVGRGEEGARTEERR